MTVYDNTLKTISKGLDRFIKAINRMQNHAEENTKSQAAPPAEPKLSMKLAKSNHALIKRLLDALKAASGNAENKAFREHAECCALMLNAMLSLANILVEKHDKLPIPASPDLAETLVNCCEQKLQATVELSYKTLSQDIYAAFTLVFNMFAMRDIIVAATSEIRYSADMDRDFFYMKEDAFRRFVEDMKAHVKMLGANGYAFEADEFKDAGPRKNPFIRLSGTLSDLQFTRSTDRNADSENSQYMGYVLMHVRAPEGTYPSDFAAALTKDQAIRLQRLFAAFSLADCLFILDHSEKWPHANAISTQLPPETRIQRALEKLKCEFKNSDKAESFKTRKVWTEFVEHKKAIYQIAPLMHPFDTKCDIDRMREAMIDIVQKASDAVEPISFPVLLEVILRNADYRGDALRSYDKACLEARAQADSFAEFNKIADQFETDNEESERAFNAIVSKNLAKRLAYIAPSRYAQDRAHRVVSVERNADIGSAMNALLQDVGLTLINAPEFDQIVSYHKQCKAWSAILPPTIVLVAVDLPKTVTSKVYLCLLSADDARLFSNTVTTLSASSGVSCFCGGKSFNA